MFARNVEIRIGLQIMTGNTHPEMDRFRVAAANFIQTVDSANACEREVFLAQLSHSLAELYSRALDLPGVEPDTASIGEAPFSIQEWAALCDSLRSKIGPLDTYWKIFDSTANEPPVQGRLSSDISEIYSDLKHDLRLENTGISHPDLLWELRFSFRSPIDKSSIL
jgi:Domain of unknown function (DUF5063)